MTIKRRLAILLIITLTFCSASFAQWGVLDATFNSTGYVTIPVGNGDDDGNSVAIQQDGKILIAGDSYNGSDFDIAVVRLNEDGTIDNTFGTNGIVTATVNNSYTTAKKVLVQSDGKIVLAGYFFNSVPNFDFCCLRFNSDGSSDNTFGGDGIVTTAIGSGHDFCNGAVLQADGKIVLAGSTYNGSSQDFALVRYNTDGTLDNTFGGDGIVTTSISNNDDFANAVTIQDDGKIVAAGRSYISAQPDIAVIRYNTDGTLDNTFSSDGKVTTNINGNDDGFGVAVQPDGKIVVCGEAYDNVSYNIGVVRYTDTGTLDNTFSGDGKVSTAVGSTYDGGYAVGIDNTGKIVVAGKTSTASNDDICLVRYTTTGGLDNTFGSSGKVTTNVANANDVANAILMLNDGKILVGGSASNGSNLDLVVLRYTATFGVGITKEKNASTNIQLFPNPASDETVVTFSLPKPECVEMELLDEEGNVTGILLNQKTFPEGENHFAIKLPAQLSAGLYFLQLKTTDAFFFTKLLVN